MDVALTIRRFNKGRDPERLAMKYARMRASPFVFLRGSCHLFHQRLPVERALEGAPRVWVCGDLHLENFGSYKGDNRLAYFDMNDFDEAALAPCTWDVLRFLTSVRLGMRELKVQASGIASLCQVFLDSYARELATGKARWVERETSEGLVRELLGAVQSRPRPAFLDTRTERKGKRRMIRIDSRKALPASDAQRQQVTAFMEAFAASQDNPDFFRILDVARRIAGTGSLGVEHYVILVRGRGSPDGSFLLDLKQALPSSLTPRLKVRQPEWKSEAHRVVAVQRRVQAVSMAFLQPVRMAKKPYILRALQPSEDRVALQHWHGKLARLEGVMASMGAAVAWGHLRAGGREGSAIADELIAFGAKSRWKIQIEQIAEHCAEQARRDWLTYAQAYDDGYFSGEQSNADVV
jgi:uncharacterized protein (DUF2252 family)